MSGGASVAEASKAPGQMKSDLFAGLDAIDLNQTVVFTQYRRVVLPADGFVFWVKADILSPSALGNTSVANSATPNAAQVVAQRAPTIVAQGSLHHTTTARQDADETLSVNRMVFTSKQQINDLDEVDPHTMYLAAVGPDRFAFSTRSGWYHQAGLYHYSGDAVYPVMASQIIDSYEQIEQRDMVISNSLPIWLTFNQMFPVFPSMLVPENIKPPYAVVDIDEGDTSPMQSAAWHDRQGNRWQLVKDVVRVTTYGVRNSDIMDWMDMVNQYTLENPSVMGVMNSPVPRDAKRGQVEVGVIAQKKMITFDVNYYQARIRNLSRQYILSAFLGDFITTYPLEVKQAPA